jgi:uncharacterized protein (TIGR02145 family)
MSLRRFILVITFSLTFTGFLQAQLAVTQGAAMSMTPLQLVQNWLLGQGVSVSNVTFNGSTAPITSNQIGYFTATNTALTELHIASGMIMTSGAAASAIGPNNTCGTTGNTGNPGSYNVGDPDLYILADTTIHDACIIEFDFIPNSDTLRFRYEFGSEELFEYCGAYNDAFGFFLSGPGITGIFSNNSVNIALIPNSTNYVTINNICSNPGIGWCNSKISMNCTQGSNPPGYINCMEPLGGGQNLQYNAFTYVYTAWHAVVPCSTYHIKLAIGDAADGALDSGVFLEKNSFMATGLQVATSFDPPNMGSKAIEGCTQATVSFLLPQAATTPYTVNYTIGGTAVNGVDYVTIPSSVTIPVGQDSTGIIINPFLDNLPEGIETVILGVDVPSCNGSSTYKDTIRIYDNFTLAPFAGNDTTICEGNSVTLHASQFGGQPPYSYSWSTSATTQNITVSPPIGVNQYIVTVHESCGTYKPDTVNVTVVPKPIVTTVPVIQTICSDSVTNILLQSSQSNPTYTWTATCNSAATTGYSNSSGLKISQTLINTGTKIDTVVYTVTASANGCTGQPTVCRVRVTPRTYVMNGVMTQTICSGHNSTLVTLTGKIPGTTFTWTASATPGITGFTLSGTGPIPVQTIVNPGSTQGTVTYHIIPTSNLGLACPGPPADYTILVDPLPAPSITGSAQACATQSVQAFSTADIPGHSYAWSVTGGAITAGAGTYSVTVTWGAAGTGVLKVIETNGATGCADSTTKSVIINPLPSPVISGPDPVCELSTLFYSATQFAGHTYAWTVSGGSIQSGNGTNQVSVKWGFAGTGTLNVTETNTLTGCYASGPTLSVTLNPYPLAAGTITGPDTLCDATTGSLYTVPPVTFATSYTWTYSGTGATIVNHGNTATVNLALNSTSGFLTVKGNNLCGSGPSASFAIHIKPLPYVAYTLCNDATTTLNAKPWTLTGGVPRGGTYAGTGVTAGVFNPATAGLGPHTITFTYMASWGCANSATKTVTVVNPAAFACGNTLTDVRDARDYATVTIGTQCWMAENLDYGTDIPMASMQRDNCITEKYCFNDLASNCTSMGGFYQWDELMQYASAEGIQGMCPPGWHIPTETEWNVLIGYLNGQGFAGSPLKYTGFSGFNALLDGSWIRNKNWYFNAFAGFIWSSTAHGPRKAWAHSVNSYVPSVPLYPALRDNAFPVRCIKD